jgi:hypothetical protein
LGEIEDRYVGMIDEDFERKPQDDEDDDEDDD